MATPRDSSKQLFAAVRGLAGEPARKVTHGDLFRIEVQSVDGHKHAATVQVDTHRKVPSKAAMNDLADRWRLPRDTIDSVLADWTCQQLESHLSALTHEELCCRDPVSGQDAKAS